MQCPGTPGGNATNDRRRGSAERPNAADPLCRAGHAGPRCYSCAPGYGLQDGLCSLCPAQTDGERDAAAQKEFKENVGVLFAASALVFTVVGLVSLMNIRAADRGRSAEDSSDFTPFVKIVINYFQASKPPLARARTHARTHALQPPPPSRAGVTRGEKRERQASSARTRSGARGAGERQARHARGAGERQARHARAR